MNTWNWWSTDSKVGWRSENKKGKAECRCIDVKARGILKGE
jgi:hypothetical protein